MDPITTAIVVALGQLGENVISDAYNALKVAIAKKCGVDNNVTEAIEYLEKKPVSTGRKETLKEEVESAAIDKDIEIVKLAQLLLDKLEELDASKEISTSSTMINQKVTGDNALQIGQVSGDATINR